MKTKNPNFDIPMGSYDSAEVTDVVGLYLLHLIEDQNWGIGPGGYRDDFAAHSDLTNQKNAELQRKLCKLFKNNGLKIEITANNAIVIDFHDVTLDMRTGNYKPYHKPNASLLYVHAQSNHPKSIKKNIPINVNKRLNILSINEEMFDEVKGEYQEALEKAGHTHVLRYEKVNLKDLNKKKRKRQRYKHMFYFHLPHEDTVHTAAQIFCVTLKYMCGCEFSLVAACVAIAEGVLGHFSSRSDVNAIYNSAVATKGGKWLLEILDKTIPPEHELHPLLNRHTVKVGYSCMDNLKKKITNHNSKVSKSAVGENDYNENYQAVVEEDWNPCNCQGGL